MIKTMSTLAIAAIAGMASAAYAPAAEAAEAAKSSPYPYHVGEFVDYYNSVSYTHLTLPTKA